ncbi:ATP-binding protein [Roseovarius sp. MMSF_3281]|uniref:ATP-binding protein n=1 Tax=Roseovarius sp. MMSF_3281 TaxID=3046694 RepID=UPI00273E73EA|nr:ATP-binding protein [Roseovarius sp. MMSF_3281]
MACQFSLSATATQSGVRDLLTGCRRALVSAKVPAAWRGTVELVWAEALNNIAEHAYADDVPGPVKIMATVKDERIAADIRDRGRPLPGLSPPPRHLPDSDGPTEALPEGGFGWFLIKGLCETVEYQRKAGENHLHLVVHIPRYTA